MLSQNRLSHILYLPFLSCPLPLFLCSLQMLSIPWHHMLLPLRFVLLHWTCALLSLLIKYDIFGLAFIPSPSLPEVDCCCSPLPDFFLSVFCLITSQLLPCNRPFGIIPKSIDKLHRVLGVSTGKLLFNYPIRSVASLDQMCSRIYYSSQTWKKTSSM